MSLQAPGPGALTVSLKGLSLVTVYSKSNCQPCRLTKMALTRKGVEFLEKRIDQDPEAMAEIKDLGFLSVPVVVTSDDAWSGLRPDKIDALAA